VALNSKLASSAPRGVQTTEEKNVFAIYVSYYVKVKLQLSSMGGEVTLKLPFVLGNVEYPDEVPPATTSNNEPTQKPEVTAKQQLRKQSISMDTGIKLPTLARATIKFDDAMSNSIDIITEELNNIHNNNNNNTLGKLVRSDSSRSNLNDEGLYESNGHGTTVIQAQVHHHQQPPGGGDDKSAETSDSKFNNANQFDTADEKTADSD
jgi:Arrestin (or S-antigen), C-terminal domain